MSFKPIEEISIPEHFECKPGTNHESAEPEDSDSSFSSFNGGDLSFRSDSSNESFSIAEAPQHSAQPEQNCNYMIKNLSKKLQDIKKNITISFRTSKMDSFKLLYQESEDYPGEVAVMAQFMPTFESKEREEFSKGKYTEEDDESGVKITTDDLFAAELDPACDMKYNYIFVIDKSENMKKHDRMLIAQEALSLFIKSLPNGSRFQILRVGSKYTYLKNRKASTMGMGVVNGD